MPRIQRYLVLTILIATSLFVLLPYSVTYGASWAQGSPQSDEDGQEYVIQRGDWLSKISLEFYGTTSSWQAIVDATNAKAATDPRFTVIIDPDEIEVGQLLWIPNVPAEEESDAGASDDETTDGDDADSEPLSVTVEFAEPQDGDVVAQRFDVMMEAQGLTVEPAGEIHTNAGHFHILVDTDFIPAGELLPFDEQHLHFGKGQITTTLELEPGTHILRLQFANGAHIALDGEQYLDTITVTVGASTEPISSTGTVTSTPEVTSTASVTSSAIITEESALPSVRFVEPLDGDTVTRNVTVTMEAQGLTVEPAGEIHEDAGHFHILVDTDFIPAGELLPFDEQHLHFGKGQLTTTVELEPGTHTLRLQFANGAHIALDGEQYRDIITITVPSD